jgi:hypothetical protein
MKPRTPKDCFEKIGPGLIQAVANSYTAYLKKPDETTRKKYLTWRLRIHLRCNKFLMSDLLTANEYFNLGLDDKDVGAVMWDYAEG